MNIKNFIKNSLGIILYPLYRGYPQVFVYHEITDKPNEHAIKYNTYITPDVFEKQIQWILKKYEVLDPSKLINDYIELFKYPIKQNEFLSIHSWWGDSSDKKYTMNGGFQKYYPKSCKYIYEKFIKNPVYWQQYYIKNGTTLGPVNGEQFFVEDSVREKLTLKLAPSEWVCRFKENYDKKWLVELNKKYPGSYVYLDEFNPDIKLVHYTQHKFKY